MAQPPKTELDLLDGRSSPEACFCGDVGLVRRWLRAAGLASLDFKIYAPILD